MKDITSQNYSKWIIKLVELGIWRIILDKIISIIDWQNK